jgi:hypothetical protein
MPNLIPEERIENKIYLIRGQKVMLDRDLAELYGVLTGRLNEQVKRNRERFPEDFIFQLTEGEMSNLISQFAISRWGGSRKLSFAFTEQGVAMLSGILRSRRAVLVNIAIMRAFVRIRRLLATHVEVSRKLKELEGRVDKHDTEIRKIFEAIQQMIAPPDSPKRKIGFITD